MKRLMIIFLLMVTMVQVDAQHEEGSMWRGTKRARAHGSARNMRMNFMKIARNKYVGQTESLAKQFADEAKAIGKTDQVILWNYLLADHYERIGDYLAAERLLTETTALASGHLPQKGHQPYLGFRFTQRTYFDVFDALGFFYLHIGNVRRAVEIFNESIERRDRFVPKRSIHRVLPVVGLGSAFFRAGNYDQAYAYFNKAFELIGKATTTGYNFDLITRLAYGDMAEICLNLGRYKEARYYIEQLAITSSGILKFGSRAAANMEVARVFEMKARYALVTGDHEKAREYLVKARRYLPDFAAANAVKFRIMCTDAELDWFTGELEGAASKFEALINGYQDYILANFAALSEYEKEQFYHTVKGDFDLFNAFVLHCHQLGKAGTLYGQLYNNQLRTKALLINAINHMKAQILNGDDQELVGTLKKWEDAKARLSAIYFQQDAGEAIDSLAKVVEALEKDLSSKTSLIGTRETAPDWVQVQQSLRSGDAAVEIIRVNAWSGDVVHNKRPLTTLSDSAVYMVLVVTPDTDQPACFVIPDARDLENRHLSYYRNAMFTRTPDTLSYNAYWLPIRARLSGVQRTYLSPDGAYNQINLNTLLNPETNEYLLDETDVVVVTNTRDLVEVTQVSDSKVACLVGRPSYSMQHSNPSEAGSFRSLANESLLTFKEQEFSDLPGTEQEIFAVATELRDRGWQVASLKGEEASEHNIKAQHRPEVLHIATHGFFIADTTGSVNPMIRSGVILAGVKNDMVQGEDGILTAYEAMGLDLEGTRLAVLSACDTGLGEVKNGEGVYGLQRAIIVAGAQNLIMSLWKVDDKVATELMSRFYSYWSGGMDVHTAFRQAQQTVRSVWTQPYYWGAFLILGD